MTTDSIAQIFQSRVRGSATQHLKLDKKDDSIYLAEILSVSMLNNFEYSVIAYIYKTAEKQKIEATVSDGASAAIGTGKFTPYFPGDKVYITYLFGDSNRPCIVARAHGIEGIPEYIQAGNSSGSNNVPNLPVTGEITAYSKTAIVAGPLATRKESITSYGFLHVETFPLLVII